MLTEKRYLELDVFDYSGNKVCPLYDTESEISGQACNVVIAMERNGWKELSFMIPSVCDGENGQEENYRLQYLVAEYRIRSVEKDEEGNLIYDWYLLTQPKQTHAKCAKNIDVKAGHISQLLKTKNLDLEFSDTEGNNVGTAGELLDTVLKGTGWTRGVVEEFYEKYEPEVIKKRTLKASAKTGAFKLISNICDLFEAKPVYHGDTRTVDIVHMNPFSDPKDGVPDVNDDKVVELHYGVNVHNVSRSVNSENLVTKFFARGAYGDYNLGYCGLETVKHKKNTVTLEDDIAGNTECHIKVSDMGEEYVIRFTAPAEGLSEGDVLVYAPFDPASRTYVWNETTEEAYRCEKYHRQEPSDLLPNVISDEENLFSYLMDFSYYDRIGLLTNEMVTTIASYHRKGRTLLKTMQDSMTDFTEGQNELSDTIGIVDFCELDKESYGSKDGYLLVSIDKSVYDTGIIYHSQYQEKEDKRFMWRCASKLKKNGDAFEDYASVVYILHEKTDNGIALYDKAYIKEMLKTEDGTDTVITDSHLYPDKLVLWTTASEARAEAGDRVLLFSQNSVNGNLGGLEISQEATKETLDSKTTIVTTPHETHFVRTEDFVPSGSGMYPAKPEVGYEWCYVYNDMNVPDENMQFTNDSMLYFCDSTTDNKWQICYYERTEPTGTVSSGSYWYDPSTVKLYRYQDSQWTYLEESKYSTHGKTHYFGTVHMLCMKFDSTRKGLYNLYTVSNPSSYAARNSFIKGPYESYYIFTTKETATKFVYDRETSMVEYGTDLFAKAKTIPEDSVSFHPANIIVNENWTTGTLKSDGTFDSSGTDMVSGSYRVYPGLTYRYQQPIVNRIKRWTVYDEGNNILSTGSSLPIATSDGAYYVRLCATTSVYQDLTPIRYEYYDTSIIAENETYRDIGIATGSGELYGIITQSGKMYDLTQDVYIDKLSAYLEAKDEWETFENNVKDILGDMYREGSWQKNDYVGGDEMKLYTDALENFEQVSHPDASYNITFLDLYCAERNDDEYSVAGDNLLSNWPDVEINQAAHLVDPEIGIDQWAFIDKISKCYDLPWKTTISINTNLSAITQKSFTDVVSNIATVASEFKAGETIYEKAKTLSQDGSFDAEKLKGKISAATTELNGARSNWYTDSDGNMIFEDAAGTGAMKITGSGFCVASDRNTDGDWVWRTFGTGNGFTADEITAGYLSAQRIEAGSISTDKISANAGSELNIENNEFAINIKVGKTAVGKVQTSHITVEGDHIDIASDGNVNIEGAEINLDGTDVNVTATSNINLASGQDLNITGEETVLVKGSTVRMEGASSSSAYTEIDKDGVEIAAGDNSVTVNKDGVSIETSTETSSGSVSVKDKISLVTESADSKTEVVIDSESFDVKGYYKEDSVFKEGSSLKIDPSGIVLKNESGTVLMDTTDGDVTVNGLKILQEPDKDRVPYFARRVFDTDIGNLNSIETKLNDRVIDSNITINVTSVTSDIEFKNISGYGKITVQYTGASALKAGGIIKVTGCSNEILFKKICAKYVIKASPYVYFEDCDNTDASVSSTQQITQQYDADLTKSYKTQNVNTMVGFTSTGTDNIRSGEYSGYYYGAAAWFNIPDGITDITNIEIGWPRMDDDAYPNGNSMQMKYNADYTRSKNDAQHYLSDFVTLDTFNVDKGQYAVYTTSDATKISAIYNALKGADGGSVWIYPRISSQAKMRVCGSGSANKPYVKISYSKEVTTSDFEVFHDDENNTTKNGARYISLNGIVMISGTGQLSGRSSSKTTEFDISSGKSLFASAPSVTVTYQTSAASDITDPLLVHTVTEHGFVAYAGGSSGENKSFNWMAIGPARTT